MAIKKNAQKLLLALYTPQESPAVLLPTESLRLVVPDMSSSGYRSLILFLQQKHLLFTEKLLGKVSVGITEEGRNVLTGLFPALNKDWSSWNGEWMVLIFLTAPKSDPGFRYLRQLLREEKSLALSRGVYLAAGSFSHRILIETKQLYHQSVAILSARQWHSGFERPVVVTYYDLASRAEVYSGISGEISRLLLMKHGDKELTYQQKTRFSSIFERLLDSLREDPGFTSFYFPDTPGVLSILSQFQKVI